MAQTAGMDVVAPALRAQGLAKGFRSTRAVDGVDLEVRPGERVALLGPNGAGKTTTLLMLPRRRSPPTPARSRSSATACPRHRSQAMERVGFAAGYLPLPDRLRVREALGIFADLCGCATRPGTRVDEALDRFGVSHLADQMCIELSSGQRTIVGICQGRAAPTALLVLDEPTASLDPDVALRVRDGTASSSTPRTARRCSSPATT